MRSVHWCIYPFVGQTSRPLLAKSLMASLFYHFYRKHCTLLITQEMKIKQLIIALAIFLYWKCPAENAGNGISEPLNLKNFPGEHAPQTPLVSRTFGGATFLSARTTSKPRGRKTVVACSRPNIRLALELLFCKEKNNFPLRYYFDVLWLINILFPQALVTLIMMKCLFLLQCTNVASKSIKTFWRLFRSFRCRL